MTKAEMVTDKGTMQIEFYDDDAPEDGRKFCEFIQKRLL